MHADFTRASKSTPYHIFVLLGFDKVPDDRKQFLAERNILLHDGRVALAAGERLVPELRGRLPEGYREYGYLCFVRWLALAEIFKGQPFVHADLDLFFQLSLDEAGKLFAGKSGTFSSPCLTSVGSWSWIESYSRALIAYSQNPEGFQHEIGFTGNMFHRQMLHDQDLTGALEHIGLLERTITVLDEEFAVFNNPLFPYLNPVQRPRKFQTTNGWDTIDKKPVLFWHFQNDFAKYLARFDVAMKASARYQLPLRGRLGLPVRLEHMTPENAAFHALEIAGFAAPRSEVAKAFLMGGQWRALFSDEYWWEPNVFESGQQPMSNSTVPQPQSVELPSNRSGIRRINEIVAGAFEAGTAWRDHVILLINELDLCGAGVEIGTAHGAFALQILERTNIAKLACIDPWIAYDDFNDCLNDAHLLDSMFLHATATLSQFGPRVELIRSFSVEAAEKFADSSLDFVYVDGNHKSAFVQADLRAWWPKLKPTGIIFGDDCLDVDETKRNADGDITVVHTRKPDGTPDAWGDYGVYHAIKRFCADRGLHFVLMGNQFAIPNLGAG